LRTTGADDDRHVSPEPVATNRRAKIPSAPNRAKLVSVVSAPNGAKLLSVRSAPNGADEGWRARSAAPTICLATGKQPAAQTCADARREEASAEA